MFTKDAQSSLLLVKCSCMSHKDAVNGMGDVGTKVV